MYLGTVMSMEITQMRHISLNIAAEAPSSHSRNADHKNNTQLKLMASIFRDVQVHLNAHVHTHTHHLKLNPV